MSFLKFLFQLALTILSGVALVLVVVMSGLAMASFSFSLESFVLLFIFGAFASLIPISSAANWLDARRARAHES